jgi:hypothetical protein
MENIAREEFKAHAQERRVTSDRLPAAARNPTNCGLLPLLPSLFLFF